MEIITKMGKTVFVIENNTEEEDLEDAININLLDDEDEDTDSYNLE